MDSVKEELVISKDINDEFEQFSKSIYSILAITMLNMTIYHVNSSFSLYFTVQADIYVFISGMLLVISLLRNKDEIISWKHWYKKRIVRIYPTLILSTLFILLYRFISSCRLFGS